MHRPPAEVLTCAAAVQGKAAPGQIIAALARLMREPRVDVILIARGGGGNARQRRIVLAVAGVATLVAIWLSRFAFWAAEFPESSLGRSVADGVNTFSDGVVDTFGGLTDAAFRMVSLIEGGRDADWPWTAPSSA